MSAMMSGSFPCGVPFGVPVRVHYSFVLVLAIQVLFSIFDGGIWPLYWFLILGPILLVTVLVHELGHCLAARQVGGHADLILLWPLGGLAFIGHDKGPKSDIWVAVAGPLTHVPGVAFWLLALLAAYAAAGRLSSFGLLSPFASFPLTTSTLGMAVCSGAVILNITLFLFNLCVPAYPLDGGRILVDVLLWCGVSEATTAVITVAVATPLAIGIVVLGGIWRNPFTILVGVWILWVTWQLFDAYRKQQLYCHPLFAYTAAQRAQQGGAGQPPVNPFAVPQPPPGGVVQGYPVPPPYQPPAPQWGGAGRV